MITPLECANIQNSDYRKEHGYPDWIKIESDKYDTQFFMYKKLDGELIICFCPSNSNIDWKNNFHFWKKAYKHSETPFKAHSGFLRCWKQVRDYIETMVEQMNPECITITGWSYGGALAILCMEDMAFHYPDMKLQCITFGAPRVIFGYKNWDVIKERWNKEGLRNTIHFKNGSDIVTAVPLIMMGFHHVVPLTHIGQPIRFWRYLYPGPWKYHEINDYIRTISKIVG